MSKIEKPIEQSATLINENDFAELVNLAQELAPSDIIGMPLKFVKGRWRIKTSKDEETEVTATRRFIVDPLSYADGWYRWQGKKPTFKIIGRRVDLWVPPSRDALPDKDESKWEIDSKGARDPWQEVQMLLLKDLDTGDLLTWQSDSYGGRLGIGEFFKKYSGEARQHPSADPVVILTSWERPTTDWGKIPTPRLQFIDWQPFGEDRTAPGDPKRGDHVRKMLQMALEPKPKLAAIGKTPAGQGRRDDMDDEIVF